LTRRDEDEGAVAGEDFAVPVSWDRRTRRVPDAVTEDSALPMPVAADRAEAELAIPPANPPSRVWTNSRRLKGRRWFGSPPS